MKRNSVRTAPEAAGHHRVTRIAQAISIGILLARGRIDRAIVSRTALACVHPQK